MHMIEVERKRIVDKKDLPNLISKLNENNFIKSGHFVEIDRYFTRSDIDYIETMECLRTRIRGEFAEITYKPPTIKKKNSSEGITSKKELNLILSDSKQAEAANQLLEVIGLIPVVTVYKNRTNYKNKLNDNITISIDEIGDAGIFVEVEIISTETNKAQEELKSVEKVLGILNFDILDKSYRDIVMESEE